jgi:hypothetical protein
MGLRGCLSDCLPVRLPTALDVWWTNAMTGLGGP